MARQIPCVLTLFAGLVAGQAPAQELSPARQPHAYDITPAAGPWAILVQSYAGDQASSLAFEFVSELRRDYKKPAYFFNRGDETRREEEARLTAQKQQRQQLYQQLGVKPEVSHFKRLAHIEDQFAVLIAADFKDMDTARMVLEQQIRKLKPPSERLMHRVVVAKPTGGGQSELSYAPVNPFLNAFVVRNPTVPRQNDPEADKRDEALLRDLNAGESYSLIHKCPGKWTLVVKRYCGPTVVVSRESEKSVVDRAGLSSQKSGGDMMGACAKSAHQLAEILRNKQLNFEAYVLHWQNMSLVTVGSFNSEKDPRMLDMMGTLSKLRLEPYETLMNPPQPFPVPK